MKTEDLNEGMWVRNTRSKRTGIAVKLRRRSFILPSQPHEKVFVKTFDKHRRVRLVQWVIKNLEHCN